MKIGGDKVGITWNQTTEAVDEIILEIIKRIDSRIQELEDERQEIKHWDMTQEDKELQDLLVLHRIEESKYVKEMLKYKT